MPDDDIQVRHYVDDLEAVFFDQDLLKTAYLRRLREVYDDTLGTCFLNRNRSYARLLELLQRIHGYKETHARSFVKRLKAQAADFRSCESIFAEVIVYGSYVPLVSEGGIKALDLDAAECDVIVERADGTKY